MSKKVWTREGIIAGLEQAKRLGINGYAKRKEPDACPRFCGAILPSETVLVFNCGCASTRVNGKPVTVCECELHGRCITFDRGELRDPTIKRCSECEDNPLRRQPLRSSDLPVSAPSS